MTDRKPPLFIYPSRWRQFVLAVVTLLFVSVGIFVVLKSPAKRFMLVCLVVPFSSIVFVHLVHRLIRRQPDLIVTDEGIFDNQGILSVGFIGWDEVEDVYPGKGAYDIRFVRVVLRDPAEFLARRPYFRRFGRRSLWKRKRIDIGDTGLPLSTEELFSKMWEYMPERVRNA